MPPVNQPKKLYPMAEKALCQYIFSMVSKGAALTESTDGVLQGAEEELEKLIMLKKQNVRPPEPCMENTYKAALHLKNVQTMLEKHGTVPDILSKNLSYLPASISNVVINQMFVFISELISYDEEQIKKTLIDKWSFGPRVRVGLHVVIKSMLSIKISTLDFNPISNLFCKVLAEYFMKPEQEDNEHINDLQEKKDGIFTNSIFRHKDNLVNVTTLSLQNLASTKLLWCISCCCPNLWYLDISGKLFNLERYCTLERISKTSAVTADDIKGRFEEFISSLSGLVGSVGFHHHTFAGHPKGCFYLRTLLLPEAEWNDAEEIMLDEHGSVILQRCTEMQELTGVNLYKIFLTDGGVNDFPHVLKLRKFYGGNYRGGILSVPQSLFKRVRLPLVTEVDIILNVFMGPKILGNFPNMKHLKVAPHDYLTYTCSSMLPYVRNLHTLDIKFTHEMTINDMCEIAKHCQCLESLKLACPALRMVDLNTSSEEKREEASENYLSGVAKLLQTSEYCKAHHKPQTFPEYIQTWLKIDYAPYEREDSQIPKFSRLLTLMFSDVHCVDAAALYKCIKGSPKIQTFSLVAVERGNDQNIEIDDDFVCRVSPLLKCVQDFSLGAKNEQGCSVLLNDLTGASVEHIVNFCKDIQSIGSMASWDMNTDEVNSLNRNFEKQNYILRLC